MSEETREYLEYLLAFKELQKPQMPNFDLLAYNENEYKLLTEELEEAFKFTFDLDLTIEHLQGGKWT